MSEYVKKEDVIALFEKYHPYMATEVLEFQEELHDMPSADVTEVVRCKDCIYDSCSPDHGNACCDTFYGMTDQMGFCSYGERKEQDHEYID